MGGGYATTTAIRRSFNPLGRASEAIEARV